MSENPQNGSRPTVVLVHGAFAESASWDDVIVRLQDQGYTVIAAANPIRSVSGDADFLASIFEAVDGPVVAVGHSYGGAVITNALRDNVKALVYVAGFAPEEGESAFELSGRFPGSTLGEALWPIPLSDGSTDLYIRQEEYHQQFAEDVPAEQTALMAVGNGLCGTSRSTMPRGPRRGSRSRRSSCSGSSTRISPWRRTASWPSGPGLARSWRSRAHPTRWASHTPRRWPT
jgi:pimeloyl-ACP methyl ester carboxylesterase